MNNEKGDFFVGSIVADAFVLGCHWVYDTEKIKNTFGVYDQVHEPMEGSYHTNRHKGELTHYGDQTMLLTNYIKEDNGFSQEGFRSYWVGHMKNYDGYVDGATKVTLELAEKGKKRGSRSHDLAGVSRIAPIIAHFTKEEGIQYAIQQTEVTHGHPLVVITAEFFARVAYALVDGVSLKDAVKNIIVEMEHPWLIECFDLALKEIEEGNDLQAVEKMGQACDIKGALPSTLYFLLKYENYKEAMIANAMAGGDSSARGMLIGMLMGFAFGGIPEEWVEATEALQV